MMASQARIQLEGSLEVVEAEVARLKAGVAELRGDGWSTTDLWHDAGPSQELAAALSACRRKAAAEAEVAAVFRELERLQGDLETLAGKRLAALRLPRSEGSAVRALRSHVPLIVTAADVGEAEERPEHNVPDDLEEWAFSALTKVFERSVRRLFRLRRTPLLITQRAIVINGELVEYDQVLRVTALHEYRTTWTIMFFRTQGPELTVRASGFVKGWLDALEAKGVAVRR